MRGLTDAERELLSEPSGATFGSADVLAVRSLLDRAALDHSTWRGRKCVRKTKLGQLALRVDAAARAAGLWP